jgi:hypothetical protein
MTKNAPGPKRKLAKRTPAPPVSVEVVPVPAPVRPTHKPEDYYTLPLDLFSVTDLTDALGIEAAAKILGTSCRAIYTVRNTNEMGLERVAKLQEAIKRDETQARRRLVQMRNLQTIRQTARAARAARG